MATVTDDKQDEDKEMTIRIQQQGSHQEWEQFLVVEV